MAVLYVKKQDGKLEEVGRTEVVQNSLNPAWITKICVNYQFEMVQNLVYVLFVFTFYVIFHFFFQEACYVYICCNFEFFPKTLDDCKL
jgi:hypothetical protein